MTIPDAAAGDRGRAGAAAVAATRRPLPRRASRQLALAAAVAAGLGAVHLILGTDDAIVAWSMATAYVSLGLLVLALAVGPWRVLRGRAPTVNSGLRRDLGIWGGAIAVAHTVVGLQVHFRGQPWLYFVPPPERRGALPLRVDGAGLANYTGLAATLLVLLLLALSNDRALRRLGTARWKRWQRLNYALMALVAVHALVYQVLEGRPGVVVALVLLPTLGAAALQAAGYRRFRATTRKNGPTASSGRRSQRRRASRL